MRLLLVSHAVTAWNAEYRFQGWTDTPLSDAGKRQAELLGNRLATEHIDVCHASTLRRARETADTIARKRGLLTLTDPRLREMNFGRWEGLTYPDICHEFSQEVKDWEMDPVNVAPPGGETVTQLAERVRTFLASLDNAQRGQEQSMLIVAHRGSLRVLICLALGMPAASWWQFRLEPGSISELTIFSKGALLSLLNETAHLRETANAC